MKNLFKLLLFLTFLALFHCDENNEILKDHLQEIGILGRWEISNEVMNGVISDMLPKCCEFLEFDPDNNIRDYKGLLTSTDSYGLIKFGIFELDIDNKTVLFIDDDNDEFVFEFSVDDSQENLTINFSEDRANYTQVWLRVD